MRRLVLAVTVVCVLAMTGVAYAATIALYPGSGVAGARLGSASSSAVSSLKRVLPLKASAVDNNYAGQRVFEYFFGTRLSNKHYPVEMYANKSHRVFIFEVNSPLCVTAKGIKVGSTESQLKAAYPTLKKRTTPTYFIYSSGGASNHTDFYVSRKTKKLTRVLISRY